MDGLHRYLPAIQMLEKEIEPDGWNLLYATIDISEDGLTVAKYQDSEQIAFPKEFCANPINRISGDIRL